MTDSFFREVQRFSRSWLLAIVVLAPLAGVGAVYAGLRDRGESSAPLVAAAAVAASLPILLFAVMRLTVDVRPDLLRVRRPPREQTCGESC